MLSPSPPQNVPRPPWAAVPTALIAMAALYMAHASWILPLSGLLLLAAQLSDTRFDKDSWALRGGRYTLFAALLFGAYLRFTSDTGTDSLEMIFAHTVGQLCAAEMMLQAWSQRPTGGSGAISLVFLATMVFLSASNTYDNRFIPFSTPLFFLCLGVTLRQYGAAPPAKPRGGTTLAVAALLLAVGMGAGVHYGVWQYRNEISQWGMKYLEGRSLNVTASGLSTTPNLGSSFNIQGGLTRMLRTEGLPVFSYLRAMSFADYRSGKWLPLLRNRQLTTIPAAFLRPNAPGTRARIERLVADEGLLFTPLNAAGLKINALSLEWEPQLGPVRALIGEEDTTRLLEVILAGDEHQGPLCAAPDAQTRAKLLNVPPEIDPRVRLLAQQIGGDAETAQEKVRAVVGYLITHHAYSLNARPGEGDKISDFLLNKRDAHCEYFASSAVILLRCLGVPTRYVIGYLAHEPDGDNALVVRSRDAHAWAESYVEGGWTTVEATPGGGRPDGRAEPLPTTFKWREKLTAWLSQARQRLAQLQNLPLPVWFGLVAALLAWLIFRAWRQRARTALETDFCYTARDAELAQIAARFEKWLARRGLPCPPRRTWREHSENIGLSAAQRFIHAYETARFGPHAPDIATLKALLHELENLPRNETKP